MKPTDISSIKYDFKLFIPKFTKELTTLKISQKVQAKYGNGIPAEPPDINEILALAKDTLLGVSKETLSDKNLKTLCYFCQDNRVNDSLFKGLSDTLITRGSRRHFGALMASYLMNFSSQSKRCRDIAALLRENRTKLSKSWLKRLERADLLDVDHIEGNLAKQILFTGNENQTFETFGLTGAYKTGPLASSALLKTATIISDEIAKDHYENVENFIELISQNGKIKPNFGQAAMVGLLLPFVDKAPSNFLKNRLKELFLSSFNDPRVSSHSWPEISLSLGGSLSREKCIAIIKKWLNFDSIELFFKIIAEHAPDEQFEPRRKLWQTYFDQEYVSDAWAVLGPSAARTASHLKRVDENTLGLRWSELTGAQSDQSVLLMKIGNLVVAEWSHSGKFRAWDESSPAKPKFYRSAYSGSELRRNSNKIRTKSGALSDGITHIGNWVPRAQQYINQQTGIRLSRKIR